MNVPRVVVAAPSGRSGKTTLCVGICAALRSAGLEVQPFKKGPDYIDPSWLSAAAGRECRNLDLFMMGRDGVLACFSRGVSQADLAVVEGAMGLYDGVDLDGTGSTAELARLLLAPVILVVDATRMTRSVAALIEGYRRFEPTVNIAAVIVNNVGNARHEKILRQSIERYCGLPVLGCVPRRTAIQIPDRHLGLVCEDESADSEGLIRQARELAEAHVDLRKFVSIANVVSPLPEVVTFEQRATSSVARIGVIRDKAFKFYYPDNIEALEAAGARLVWVDSLNDRSLPNVDALYIGGGFPEIFAEQLEANSSLRKDIGQAIEFGLPVYAECGGLMYLSKSVTWNGQRREMVGALPVEIEQCDRPQGHGYVVASVVAENPFFPLGTVISGHEFHYSRIKVKGEVDFAYRLSRGIGAGGVDGLVRRRVLAAYTHLHVGSARGWAEGFVAAAGSKSVC